MRRPIVSGFFACVALAASLLAQAPHPRIVFIGDSITEGTISRPTFRQPLWERLHGAGYCFDFVGGRRGVIGGRTPQRPTYDLDHYGFSGESSFEMCFQLLVPIPQFDADIAVIQLGTNDVIKGTVFYSLSPQQIANLADQFLRSMIGILQNPPYNTNTQIVIAQVPPLPAVLVPTPALNLPQSGTIYGLDQGILAVNAAIANLASLPGVRVVDLHTGVDIQTHLADQVHPNAAGEQLIADRMFTALTQVLPAPNPQGACFSEFGKGAGVEEPTLTASIAGSAPLLGSAFSLQVRDMVANAPIVGVIGLESAAVPLANIDEFLFVNPMRYSEAWILGDASAAGARTWSLFVPMLPHLAGLEVYVQALAFQNDAVASVTSGGILRLGF